MGLLRILRNRAPASIRREILILFAAGLVLPILVAFWLSYRVSVNAITSYSIQQQEKILLDLSRDIWMEEDQSRRQLTLLGTDPAIGTGLRAGAIHESAIPVFLRMNPDWLHLKVFDRLGREVWPARASPTPSMHAPRLDPFFLETFALNQNQGPVFAEQGRYLTRFGFRIDGPDEFLGVISASLDLSFLMPRLRQMRYQRGIRAFVWDDRGVVFGSNLDEAEERELKRLLDLAEIAKTLEGMSEHRSLEFFGEDLVFSAASVPEFVSHPEPMAGQDWFIGMLTPSSDAFAELRGFHRKVAVFLAVLFAAVAVAFGWTARRVSRPMKDMAAFAADVAGGRRDLVLKPDGLSEVRSLSAALNSMTQSLREYEHELVQKESLASMGRMCSVLAHEIRNPLNGIKGCAQYLNIRYPDDRIIQDYSTIIEQKVTHLARFMESLLHMVRLPAPSYQTLSCSTLLQRALEPYCQKARAQGVNVVVTCRPDLVIHGDEHQLTELIQNLVENSLEAMTQGGDVAVSVKQTSDRVELEFQDNGPGLPARVREKLFSPFVTGKPDGTGLGLSLCKMIAENHGGAIEYVPAPVGTCFLIKLGRESANAD